MEVLLFWVFAIVVLISALVVVLAKNPITSALGLIVTLFIIAGYYVVLSAQFLAAVQVVIYAGAIMVLFLFVIMLLNLQRLPGMFPKTSTTLILGVLVAGVLFLLALKALTRVHFGAMPAEFNVDMGSAGYLGNQLFTTYLLPFEIASVLLLSAIIGAVVLIRRPPDSDESSSE
jgi:NADH-quinone oxidoreductase subunit J